MTSKQKKVLDYMIKWADNEIRNGEADLECVARDGFEGMYDSGSAFFYALQVAGYSYKYVNDAAYGGNKGGYSVQVLWSIEQPFKDYFMSKYKKQ